jgi:hypothetical protein
MTYDEFMRKRGMIKQEGGAEQPRRGRPPASQANDPPVVNEPASQVSMSEPTKSNE